jgi:hypothetical protein
MLCLLYFFPELIVVLHFFRDLNFFFPMHVMARTWMQEPIMLDFFSEVAEINEHDVAFTKSSSKN